MHKKFSKIDTFDVEDTWNAIVDSSINQMVLTVKNELKDTIGVPRPHRKVQPLKEGVKRINKQTAQIKHEVHAIIERENMTLNHFSKPHKDQGKINHLTDKKFKAVMKLESLFDQNETKKIEEELKSNPILADNAKTEKGVHFSKRSRSTAVDFNKT